MKTVCFYHDDADGILSGALVNHFVSGEKVFIKSTYGMDINWELIGLDDTIYIVDFSFHPIEMDELCLIAKNVIWIDHHLSSINAWDEHLKEMRRKFPKFKDIDGIRKVGLAGCQLTEQYFRNSPKENSTNHRIDEILSYSKNGFELVETIGTYDVWNKNNPRVPFERAYQCMLGFVSNFNSPESGLLESLIKAESPMITVDSLVIEGICIEKYLNNFQNDKISKHAFETKLFGKRALVVNLPLKGSAPLIERYKKEGFDLMCVFFFNGKTWEYSFYTEKDDINCAYICKNLAKYDTNIGGGHKKAAGCTLTYNLFNNGFFKAENIEK